MGINVINNTWCFFRSSGPARETKKIILKNFLHLFSVLFKMQPPHGTLCRLSRYSKQLPTATVGREVSISRALVQKLLNRDPMQTI